MRYNNLENRPKLKLLAIIHKRLTTEIRKLVRQEDVMFFSKKKGKKRLIKLGYLTELLYGVEDIFDKLEEVEGRALLADTTEIFKIVAEFGDRFLALPDAVLDFISETDLTEDTRAFLDHVAHFWNSDMNRLAEFIGKETTSEELMSCLLGPPQEAETVNKRHSTSHR